MKIIQYALSYIMYYAYVLIMFVFLVSPVSSELSILYACLRATFCIKFLCVCKQQTSFFNETVVYQPVLYLHLVQRCAISCYILRYFLIPAVFTMCTLTIYIIFYIFLSLPCFSCVSLHVVDNASGRHFTHPALDLQPAVAHPCAAHSAIAHPCPTTNLVCQKPTQKSTCLSPHRQVFKTNYHNVK